MTIRNESQPKRRHFMYLPDTVVLRVDTARVPPATSLPPPGSAAIRSVTGKSGIAQRLASDVSIREIVPVHAAPPPGRRRPLGTASPLHAFAASAAPQSGDEELSGINVIKLHPDADAVKLAAELNQYEGVLYAHPVPARWLVAEPMPARFSPAQPPMADPMLNRQWALRAINYFDPGVNRNAMTVNVAVLDTGVDAAHPDLPHNITYDTGGASAEDIIGHGTHVSGIIAALANNGVGIVGMVDTRLFVWKIFGDAPYSDGNYYVDEVMYQRALVAASRLPGLTVMNLSIGGIASSITEQRLFQRLYDAGVMVCAAMGNEYLDGNPSEYPGAYEHSFAVGATDEMNRRASFSNTGDHIALCAPGVNIVSTLPTRPSSARDETEYAAWSGTSMATPHVTAAAAMLRARSAGATPEDVARTLESNALPLGGLPSGAHSTEYGFGLLHLP